VDFKSFFKNHSFKQWDKTQWTILILAGILLMVIAIPTEEKRDREVTLEEREENVSLNEESYAESLERRLQNKLSKIEGAGRGGGVITLGKYGGGGGGQCRQHLPKGTGGGGGQKYHRRNP